MDKPTLFVLPPPSSLLCSLHSGVFNSPVVSTPCGCTFCESCILGSLSNYSTCPNHCNTPLTQKQLTRNISMEEKIDDLLIRCRFGVKKNENGTLAVDNNGCPLWLPLGTRNSHESKCPFKNNNNNNNSEVAEDDFVLMEDNTPKGSPTSSLSSSSSVNRPSPPPTFSCKHSPCSFQGHTEDEVQTHLQNCSFEELVQRVNELTIVVQSRDDEIAFLKNELLLTQQSLANLQHSVIQEVEKADGIEVKESVSISNESEASSSSTEKDPVVVLKGILEDIKTIVASAPQRVKSAGTQVLDTGRIVFDNLSRDGRDLVAEAKEGIHRAGENFKISEAFSNIAAALQSMSRAARQEVAEKLNEIATAASHLPQNISQEIKELKQSIESTIQSVRNSNNNNNNNNVDANAVVESESQVASENVNNNENNNTQVTEEERRELNEAILLSQLAYQEERRLVDVEEATVKLACEESLSEPNK